MNRLRDEGASYDQEVYRVQGDGTGAYANAGLTTAIGAIIYNTTFNKLQVYTNQNASGGWETITSAYAG